MPHCPRIDKGLLPDKASAAILGIFPYYKVVLMGCGLGQHPHTKDFVKNILSGLPKNRRSWCWMPMP